ncbi:MAG: hypothetical protein IIW17_02250 [Clostridia bacterium]|nr:hypothetical protein [Clostridia bacterium]MBQ5792818.1 hypothetical protein [Clostridia bacterium]
MTDRRLITVDFASVTGRIKPLHGMCNGPLSPGTDLGDLFTKMGVPCVRFADAGGKQSGLYVNVSSIFCDASADEYDPQNYRFAPTDTLLRAAAKSGARIVYRLGESDGGFGYSLPQNAEKWARICVNIIRHYNDGWAEGMQLGLRDFEIWAKPDTMQDVNNAAVFGFYEKVAHGIKSYNPDLQVGGMGFADYGVMAREFIKYCKKKQTPLDFVSICAYGTAPDSALAGASKLSAYLQKSDMAHLPVYVSEWNCYAEDGTWLSPADKQARYELLHSLPGAVFCASVLLKMQHIQGVESATYYDAQPELSPLCGICDRFGNVSKPAHAFRAFDVLYRQGDEAFCDVQGSGVQAVASIGYRSAAVMVAVSDAPGLLDIRMNNLPEDVYSADVYILDGIKDLALVQTLPLLGMSRQVCIATGKYSIILIKLY